MPGPEDYGYEHEDGKPSEFAPLTTEVSQADSNPAYYPPEAKSEDLLTDDEKAEVEKKSAKDRGETDVVDGQGNVLYTQEQATALDARNAAFVQQAVGQGQIDPDLGAPKDEDRAARQAAADEQAAKDVEEQQKAEEAPADTSSDSGTSSKRSVPKAKSS